MNSLKIDRNKVQRVETPYGNGYYYNGRLYSDQEFESLENENNNNSFKKGGPAKPGDAGYVNTKNPVQAKNQQQSQNSAPSDNGIIKTEQPGDPNKSGLPAGYSRSQIDQLYATGKQGGMNQAAVLAFEREYGTGFRPGQPASVPAEQTQAKNPPLSSMMESNFSSNVPDDMNQGVFYGNYDDTIVRNGTMAKGVQIDPVPGDYQIRYENPIYENALRGNWTGQNVDTQVMPGQQQNTQQAAPANTADNKPAKQDGYDYTNEAPTFSAAFSAARQSGLKTFKYKGNVHTTDTATTSGKQAQAKQKPEPKRYPDQRSMKLDETKNPNPNAAQSFTSKQTMGTQTPTNRPAPQKGRYVMQNGQVVWTTEPSRSDNDDRVRPYNPDSLSKNSLSKNSTSSKEYKLWNSGTDGVMSGYFSVVDSNGKVIRRASGSDIKLTDYNHKIGGFMK